MVEIHNNTGVIKNWTFEPSLPSLRTKFTRTYYELTGKSEFPSYKILKAPSSKGNWIIYFIYAPDGRLDAAHRYTLEKLRQSSRSLLLIVASRSDALIEPKLHHDCDALVWKALEGYDFSAYTIGLRLLAKHAPGTDVLVMNDSVFGPFCDIMQIVETADWRLTGILGSSQIENHIQSFAFHIRCLDMILLSQFQDIFSPRHCYNYFNSVILLKETRMARCASTLMSVGAVWFSPPAFAVDATLDQPFVLLDQGFPFLKRSLIGKFSHLHDQKHVKYLLHTLGHPGFDQNN